MTTTREAVKPTEAEITPARQRLIDLKATMPMRDDLTCAMFAAWLGVSVDKLPGDFKQFDNPETMTAWRRVADAARAALSTPVADTRVVKPLVWEEVTDQIPKHAYAANTGFGRWIITIEFLTMNNAVYRLHGGDYATLELAKAAAQCDYETRILSAIIGTEQQDRRGV